MTLAFSAGESICVRLPLRPLTGGEDLGDCNLNGDLNATGKHLTERIGLVGMMLGFIRQLVTGGTLLDLEELQRAYKNTGNCGTKGAEERRVSKGRTTGTGSIDQLQCTQCRYPKPVTQFI